MTSVFSEGRGREKHPLNNFYAKENIEQKTELDRDDIKNVLEIEMLESYYKDVYGIDLGLKTSLTVPFKEHMVSNDRKGRTEGMEVMRAQEQHTGDESVNRSTLDRFLGR